MNMPQWIAQQRLIAPPVECHCSCHSTGAMHFMACCEGDCPKCGRFWHNLKKHVAECDVAPKEKDVEHFYYLQKVIIYLTHHANRL